MNRRAVWIVISIIFAIYLCAWWLGRPAPVQTWHLSGYRRALAISPDGQLLATTSGPIIERKIGNITTYGNTTIELRRLSDGSVVRTLDLFDVTSLAFSPDNSLIAAGNNLGQVQLWRIKDGHLLHSLRASTTTFHGSGVHTLIFTPDGQTLVTGVGGQVNVWRVADGLHRYRLSKEDNSLADISPDGQVLAIGGGLITLYRLSDGTRLRELKMGGHAKFSADGQVLAIPRSAGYEYNYREKMLLYRLEDDTIVGILPGLKGRVTDFALSRDSQYLAAAYYTGGGSGDIIVGYGSSAPIWSHLALWQLTGFSPKFYPRQILRTQKHSSLRSSALAFSHDGKILAFGGWDKTVRLWKIPPQPSWLSRLMWRLLLIGCIAGGFFYVRRYVWKA